MQKIQLPLPFSQTNIKYKEEPSIGRQYLRHERITEHRVSRKEQTYVPLMEEVLQKAIAADFSEDRPQEEIEVETKAAAEYDNWITFAGVPMKVFKRPHGGAGFHKRSRKLQRMIYEMSNVNTKC